MLTKGPKTFLDSAKPIIFFNCFVGMGAFRQPNQSDTEYYFTQIYTIIFTILNWIINYIGLTEMIDNDAYDRHNSTVTRNLYLVLIVMNSGKALTSPFFIWIHRKGLTDCLQKMSILDDIFQDIFGVRNGYRKQYILLTWQVIVIVLITFVVVVSDILWSSVFKKSMWVTFTVVFTMDYAIIVTLVLGANFCSCVGYMRKKIRDLNDGLLELAEKEVEKSSHSHPGKKISVISRRESKVRPGCRMEDMKAENSMNDKHAHLLHEIRKVHLELCKLSRKMNNVFGIQNLLSMGYSFALLTGLLHSVYCIVSLMGIENYIWLIDVVSCVLWILIYVFNVWIINYMCWAASNESDRTGDVIYEILERKVDKELQSEIQEFAVQLLQNPVRFNACGFFNLDYTFVQGVIGSITTYLVILIQMSPVSKISTSNEVLAGNVTKVSEN